MNKKYWLKGLVVAVVVYIFLYCVLNTIDQFGLLLAFLSPGTWFIIGIDGVNAGTKYVMQLLTSAVIWAVLGAFIGLVYGKMKSRRQIGTTMK